MSTIRQLTLLLCVACVVLALPTPDSAGSYPLPAPGLSYGGIPYGSVSGDVANYFNRRAPSVFQAKQLNVASVNFAPIDQYL
ncbi:uncharacterized protein LOC119831168 [Zerene cesonia]|uniref:uncharacterized protein LOC119831168 n=1 Tax=Zerene cesonia TaxID=33412 RepID=UPI0018E58A71|nr:uncharacterized protein LOC119831168 [Zerene cesonia]